MTTTELLQFLKRRPFLRTLHGGLVTEEEFTRLSSGDMPFTTIRLTYLLGFADGWKSAKS